MTDWRSVLEEWVSLLPDLLAKYPPEVRDEFLVKLSDCLNPIAQVEANLLRDALEQVRKQANEFALQLQADRKASWLWAVTPRKRKEAIDKLFDEDHLRSEIYEQMRLKHSALMGGRGKEFLDEKSMWRSYKNCGGCHPRSSA